MELRCSGNLVIESSSVKKIIVISNQEMDFEIIERNDHDKKMGVKLCHPTIIDLACPKCSNITEGQYDVWEYPAAAIDTTTNAIKGAKIIKEPNFNFIEE